MDQNERRGICRLCLVESAEPEEVGVDLRSDKGLEMVDRIHRIFAIAVSVILMSPRSDFNCNHSFQITDASNWPNRICTPCCNRVQVTAEFYDRIAENQNVILQRFGKPEPAPDNDQQLVKKGVNDEEEEEEDYILEGGIIEEAEVEQEQIIVPEEENAEKLGERSLRSAKQSPSDTSLTPPKDRKERNAEMDSTILSFLQLKCEVCTSSGYSTFVELSTHYRKTHDTEGYVTCCSLRFTRRYKLYNHITTHLNPLQHLCPLCPKKFVTRFGLDLHKEVHLPLEDKQFTCKHCSKRFLRENRLKHHLATKHVPNEQRPFKCQDCDRAFVNNSLLVDHCRRIHENLRPFICEICARSFKTKHILNDHIQTHSDDRPRVKCEECGKFYRNELQVKRHQKRTHGAEGQVFQCNVCGVQAKNAYSLTAHINLNHKTDPQKHQCEVCNKGFKRLNTLREHMAAAHTGQKLYRCSFCPTDFNSSANMYKHQKKAHQAEYEVMRKARDMKMLQPDG